jgi:hypothetical protein
LIARARSAAENVSANGSDGTALRGVSAIDDLPRL